MWVTRWAVWLRGPRSFFQGRVAHVFLKCPVIAATTERRILAAALARIGRGQRATDDRARARNARRRWLRGDSAFRASLAAARREGAATSDDAVGISRL